MKEKYSICDYIREEIKRPNDWVDPEYQSFNPTRTKIRKYVEYVVEAYLSGNTKCQQKANSIKDYFSKRGYKNYKDILGHLSKNYDCFITMENLLRGSTKSSKEDLIELTLSLFNINPYNIEAQSEAFQNKPLVSFRLIDEKVFSNRIRDRITAGLNMTGTNPFNANTIGVIDGSMLPSIPILKKLALFFDELHIIDLGKWMSLKDDNVFNMAENNSAQKASTLNFLMKEEIVCEACIPNETELQKSRLYDIEFGQLDQLLQKYGMVLQGSPVEKKEYSIEFYKKYALIKSSLYSHYISETYSSNSISVISDLRNIHQLINDPKSYLSNLILQHIPFCVEDAEWAQIMDFRSDKDSREKRLRLFRWISDKTKESKLENTISGTISHMLLEYTRFMSLYQAKYNYKSMQFEKMKREGSAFQANNIKRWNEESALLRQGYLNLIEAEQKAPGRELAYLIRIEELFS